MMKKSTFFLSLILLSAPAWGKIKPSAEKIGRVLWDKQLKSGKKSNFFPETASPVADGGRVYVGTGAGVLYAVEAGKILWSFNSKGPIAAKAATDGNRVFFGDVKGMIYALEAKTGQKQWEEFIGGEILSEPVLSNSSVFVVTTSREIYSLDKKTGKENWSTYVRGFEKKITRRGNSPLRLDGGRLYAAFADGEVVSLSSGNGNIAWTENLADPNRVFKDIDAGLVIDGGEMYAVGYFGEVARLRKDSGSVVWKKPGTSGVTPAADSSRIYVSGEGGAIIAMDKGTGLREWETPLGGGLLSAPLIRENFIFVGTEKKGAYLLDRETGKIVQRISLGGTFIGEPEATDSTVYLLTSGGKLTALIF
ncbi:MAG: PQQ-binding-like beta-propeller repeat protein [Deltaproteobacteria bacterium]|nr:PQQ-binding-like beta-propeller repeat protein [Deltaproteobacteria bacterium]